MICKLQPLRGDTTALQHKPVIWRRVLHDNGLALLPRLVGLQSRALLVWQTPIAAALENKSNVA